MISSRQAFLACRFLFLYFSAYCTYTKKEREEWESFNFYNVFARDGMNPGSADVRERMNEKVNTVILSHY